MKTQSALPDQNPNSPLSRRAFLKTSGAAAAGAALAGTLAAPRAGYTAENNTIKIALVGCGGRGTGAAANALATSGPTKLWAMADVFQHRLDSSLKNLGAQFQKQLDVAPERRFVGMDAYRKAIDSLDKGDVVLLATPAAFRPLHFEYAVERGVNIFFEKSFAVDGPGIRRVRRAGELAAQKGLKVASGLMWRHSKPREEAITRIHDGAIGDIITLRTYRMHGPVGFRPKQAGESELAHQIANYSCFNWLNASFYVDWLIHDIDVCCWAKDAWPVSAQGMGGRQARKDPDEMWDHYMVEYAFADGARLLAQGRHMTGCYDIFSDLAHGSKGSAVLMENISQPKSRIYRSQNQTLEHEVWRYQGTEANEYQVEHDLLFDTIRNNRPYNETDRATQACLTAILGRMACYSGQLVTREQAIESTLELAPGLEGWASLEATPPVLPGADGQYPIPMPGVTKAF